MEIKSARNIIERFAGHNIVSQLPAMRWSTTGGQINTGRISTDLAATIDETLLSPGTIRSSVPQQILWSLFRHKSSILREKLIFNHIYIYFSNLRVI